MRSLDAGRVDLIDHLQSLLAQAPENGDGPQQARGVVHEIEEGTDRSKVQQDGDAERQIKHRLLGARQQAEIEHEAQYEQRGDQADVIVAQEHGGDDAWRKPGARDLDGDQKGAEGEDDERQHCGNEHLQDVLHDLDVELPSPPPLETDVDPFEEADRHQRHEVGAQWDEPHRGPKITPQPETRAPFEHRSLPTGHSASLILARQTAPLGRDRSLQRCARPVGRRTCLRPRYRTTSHSTSRHLFRLLCAHQDKS